jgi:hypothetical protein
VFLAEYGKVQNANKLLDIQFTENVPIIESVATTLIYEINKMKQKYPEDFAGRDKENMFKLNRTRHGQIHIKTMSALNSRYAFGEIIKQASKDGLDGKGVIKAGKDYASSMASEYFNKLIPTFRDLGTQVWDKNVEALDFVERWNKEFEKLPELGKVAATLYFLDYNQLPSQLPPYGNDKKLMPLLHGETMKFYNDIYTKNYREIKYNPDFDVDKKASSTKSRAGELEKGLKDNEFLNKTFKGFLFKLKNKIC